MWQSVGTSEVNAWLLNRLFWLLAVMVKHAGQVLSPRQLLEQVWGWEYMQGGVQRAPLF
ncbi:MAG: winged helix-turn-helix domain-containing protein [Anaerolineae bacterium]